MEITIEHIITLISLFGAILAWIAKIRWSKEYQLAKDETIKSKDSLITELKERIQFYKDMTPMKIREYFDSVKLQMEEYNQLLTEQLESAKNEINEKEDKIKALLKNETEKKVEIDKLKTEKEEIELVVKSFKENFKNINSINQISIKLPKYDVGNFDELAENARKLGEQLAHFNKREELTVLAKKIKENLKNVDWVKQTEEWDLAEIRQNYLRNLPDEE